MRNYVLDTNVLIHDPNCLFKFKENNVLLPMTVIEELDSLKERRVSASGDAREASRNIKAVLDGEKQMTGDLFILSGVQEWAGYQDTPDNRIIGCALYAIGDPDFTNSKTVLVTKDVNVFIKAKTLGVEVEDYRNDQSDRPLVSSFAIVSMDSIDWDDSGDGVVKVEKKKLEPIIGGIDTLKYLVDYSGHGLLPASLKGDFLEVDGKGWKKFKWGNGIHPKNTEQKVGMTLLRQDELDFVCLEGPAGSGKTLLALDYAIEEMEKKKYRSIVVLRSSDSNHIGHLPGTEEEKMLPWVQGFIDNLGIMVGDDDRTINLAIEQYNIKFRSLDLVRGRSFQDTIVIVDEAQNNTRHQLKAILTRMGSNSKLIMLGNLGQIDTPYLNKRTSGLKHVCDNLLKFERGAICIFRDVHRSSLTNFAEENL